MTSIDTLCAVLPRPPPLVVRPAGRDSDKAKGDSDDIIVKNHNQVEFRSDGGRCFEFNKVFKFTEDADSKTTTSRKNEMFATCCNGLIQAFLNGYNSSLLLMGDMNCVKTILFEESNGKGLLTYLVNNVKQLATKKLKSRDNKKELSSLAYMKTASPPPTSSFFSGKVRSEVNVKLYQIHNGSQLTDLLGGKNHSSPSGHVSSFSNHYMSGLQTEKIFQHSLLGSSSKNSIRLLSGAFQNTTSLERIDDGTLVVLEFSMTKFVDGDTKPAGCRFSVIVIPSSPLHPSQHDGNDGDDDVITGKPFDVLTNIINTHLADPLKAVDSSVNSQYPLKHLLSDVIGGNVCAHALTCIDDTCVLPAVLRLMTLSATLKEIINYPVPAIPQVELMLKHHDDKVRHLLSIMEKEQKTHAIDMSERQAKYIDLQDELLRTHQNVRSDKTHLEGFVKELQDKHKELQDKNKELQDKNNELCHSHAETSSNNASETAEKLLITKEMVDLKLKGNQRQQQTAELLAEFKMKLLNEEERAARLERDLSFEQKTHAELKGKHANLKTLNTDLNEEYVNLKLNYHRLKEHADEQARVISGLKKKIGQLVDVKSQLSTNNTTMQLKQTKRFKEELEKLSALLSDIPTKKIEGWERIKNHSKRTQGDGCTAIVIDGDAASSRKLSCSQELLLEHDNELSNLESRLFSVRKQLREKDESITKLKRKLADVTSRFDMGQDENEVLKRRMCNAENTLDDLTVQYQHRLKEYVKNIRDYVSTKQSTDHNNTNGQHLQDLSAKMMEDLEKSYANEKNGLDDKIKALAEGNEILFEKCMKLMIAYRLVVANNSSGTIEEEMDMISLIHMELPDNVTVKNHQFERIKELQLKVRSLEREKRNVKQTGDHENEKLGSTFTGRGVSDLWHEIKQQISNQSKSIQQTLEREKAELLTRCTLAEQELQSCREEMRQQNARYGSEICYQQHYEQSDRQKYYRQPGESPPLVTHLHRVHMLPGTNQHYPKQKSRYQGFADRLNNSFS